MKALVFAAAALLMALGSISVGVNAQATAPHKTGSVVTTTGARDVQQPGPSLVLKDVNGVPITVMGHEQGGALLVEPSFSLFP